MGFLVGLFILAALVNVSFQQGAQTITLDSRTDTLNYKSSPVPYTIQVPLLSGPAKLSVQATTDLQICLQRGLKVSSDASTWSTGCLEYRTYKKANGTTTYTLNLKNFAHQLGFWFVNNATSTSSVTYNMTGEQCTTGVGSECVAPIELSASVADVSVASTADVTYFRLNSSYLVNTSRISFEYKLNNDSSLSLPVAASYGSVPTWVKNDVNGVLSFQVVSPSPLTWIIVINNQQQDFTYRFTIQSCSTGLGYSCNTTVTNISDLAKNQMIRTPSGTGSIAYFKFNANGQNNDLDMNIKNVNRSPNNKVKIYLKYGNLPSPTEGSYDYLNSDNIFEQDFLTNGPWFFAIMSDNEFGLWLGDGCPNYCSKNGICKDRTCVCDSDDFFLIDCSATVSGKGSVQPNERPILIGIGVAGLIAIGLAIGLYYFLQKQKQRDAERNALFSHELPERVPDSERLDEHSY
jgi:hypothetical protein